MNMGNIRRKTNPGKGRHCGEEAQKKMTLIVTDKMKGKVRAEKEKTSQRPSADSDHHLIDHKGRHIIVRHGLKGDRQLSKRRPMSQPAQGRRAWGVNLVLQIKGGGEEGRRASQKRAGRTPRRGEKR